jgi:hypothetical protein
VVTIAVGGDGNIGPESVLLLLIIIKWCRPEGTREQSICGKQGYNLGGVCRAMLRANEQG